MKFIKAFLTLAFTVALCYVLNTSIKGAPAFGSFLNPFTGFWVNGEKPISDATESSLEIPGLQCDFETYLFQILLLYFHS